ncbi:MAG: carbohydrate-binding family 9-like protein [Armatimonadota bacterium]|nr:carbohydrate-binding family 9-like protein [Armatimonadota bacterium]
MDEAAWQAADPAALKLHDNSGFPNLTTTVRLCYDNQFLYVAFECKDTEIQAAMTERDAPIYEEEVVEVFLDPDSDELTYYEFEVSPRNVIFDAVATNPTGVKGALDTSWDCAGLQTAVCMANGGWTVEIAIPFSSLTGAPHTPPAAGDRWRMNLYRIERAPREEFSCWSPTMADPPNYHVPGMFGVLQFA